MDYKELIERIEDSCDFAVAIEEDDLFTTLKDAADAIETLLAERDAAVEDLKGRCDICKHRCVCLFDEHRRVGCANSKRGHWQWRGPKKEGDGHGQ